MSFDYNRKNNHGQGESFWTSNSDLFLGLSSIFLLLYVVSSLRSGADGIQSANENKKLKMEVQDLKNQLKTYESVKDQYLQSKADKSEVDEYNELMDKLTLLKEEAKNEKDGLRKQASENEQKEKALNKYQQLVRNMINSTNLAKTKVINRNEVIVEKNEQIVVQDGQINQLTQNVTDKENMIKAQEAQIRQVNNNLASKMVELKKTFQHAKLTQKAYQARLKKLKAEAESKVAMIEQQKRGALGELRNAQQTLAQTQSQLANTQGQLSNTQGQLAQTAGQLSNTKGQLANAQGQLSNTQGQLAQTTGQLANTQGKLAQTQGQLQQTAAQAALKERQLAGELAGLGNQLKSTEGQLAQAKAELAVRQNIAKEIKSGFDRMGVKADIDLESGDVLLDFGQAYFESGSAQLKDEMRKVLQKAMPIYSKSLFGNPSVSSKISAVEVIGFASPTYKGRFVDPNSSKPEDREALKYNMDLSYQRAKSIFNYILDEKEMNFQHRQTLVPNLKVSGRSFLDLVKLDRNVASAQEYCVKNDCKKSQRVIIRFSMDRKK